MPIPPTIRPFIVQAGRTTQALGHGRVVGQIYAYLYFNEFARSLTDMQKDLGISKGSASTAVRLLEEWGAVQRRWIEGDRRDYFEAITAFGRIIRRALATTVHTTMTTTDRLIDDALEDVDETDDPFLHSRLEHLDTFRRRALELQENPVLRTLFG